MVKLTGIESRNQAPCFDFWFVKTLLLFASDDSHDDKRVIKGVHVKVI